MDFFIAGEPEIKNRFGVNLSGLFVYGGRGRIAEGFPALCPSGQLPLCQFAPGKLVEPTEFLTRPR